MTRQQGILWSNSPIDDIDVWVTEAQALLNIERIEERKEVKADHDCQAHVYHTAQNADRYPCTFAAAKNNTTFQLDNLLSVLSPADAEAAGLSLVSGVRILDHSSALFGRTKFTVSVMVLFLGFKMRGSLASITISFEVLALGQLASEHHDDRTSNSNSNLGKNDRIRDMYYVGLVFSVSLDLPD